MSRAEGAKMFTAYRYRISRGAREGSVDAFQPRTVFAWKEFPKDATRWALPESE